MRLQEVDVSVLVTLVCPMQKAVAVGQGLRRQRCQTVVKNPNRLVSSGPGTPPLPIHDGKSGKIRSVRWNGGGTGTYLPETYGLRVGPDPEPAR